MNRTSLGSIALASLALGLAGCAAPQLAAPGLPPHLPLLEDPELPGQRVVTELPAGLDDDLPMADCTTSQDEHHDQAGNDVQRWTGCIRANVPLFEDPSLGEGPRTDVEVPRGTAWMLVLVHVHGQE
ncbi:MAG: hypothetical protein LC624_12090, partial [Halobacteriales archaeon]|nr:hypothetical protein [Halobacteriales archaeon]